MLEGSHRAAVLIVLVVATASQGETSAWAQATSSAAPVAPTTADPPATPPPTTAGATTAVAASPAPPSDIGQSDVGGPSDRALDISSLNMSDLIRAASKIELPISEAPALGSLTTRDQIRDYGWLSLNDILYRQPGFAPAQDYDRQTVSARGSFESWNNNHLLLLIDGVPYNDNLYGTAFTSEVTPLFMARSVEILRDPGSALYGQYAMNGVIAINTLSAADVTDGVTARARVGDHGTQIYDAMAAAEGSLVSGVVAFNYYRTDGNVYSTYDASGRTTPGSTGTCGTYLDATGNTQQRSGSCLSLQNRDARNNTYMWVKLEGNAALKGLQIQFHNQAWSFETGHGWLWEIPDSHEAMSESRQAITLSYDRDFSDRFSGQLVVGYQRHNIDWNTEYVPSAATGATGFGYSFPNGAWEYLKTSAGDYLARAQLSYKLQPLLPWLGSEASILAGAESTLFLYDGDAAHNSNVDINATATGSGAAGPSYGPLPTTQPDNAWLQPIAGHPLTNFGAFAQLATGRALDRRISVTAGLRYDDEFFRYSNISLTSAPIGNKSFNALNPRAALIVFPTDSFRIKLLYGQAFRAPTPSELFGSNTLSLASNIGSLQPETIKTGELGLDWDILRDITVRADAYLKEFDNQIAYSLGGANLSTNIFSQRDFGTEAELLAQKQVGSASRVSGFLNYSYVRQLAETILDPSTPRVAQSDTLVWYPSHILNAGVRYEWHGLRASAQAHYQGVVARRSSDLAGPALAGGGVDTSYDSYRSSTVPAYVQVDARLAYRVVPKLEVGLMSTNLLDTIGYLVKNNYYPFDYRIESRSVMANAELLY